jgi:Winged helix-turn-helix DNA-binding
VGAAVARVTIREAAERLGVSQDTVKRRLKRGELQGVQEPRPQGFVWLVELPDEAAAAATPPPSAAEVSAAEVRRLDQMVDLLREQLANRERDIRELHVLLEQAQRALPPPPRESEPAPEPLEYPPPQTQGSSPDEGPEQLPWWRRLFRGLS